MNTTFVYSNSVIETVHPTSMTSIMRTAKESGSRSAFGCLLGKNFFTLHSSFFTLKGIYRRELKAARRMALAIDQHPTLSNACLWAMTIAIFVEIFLYA